MTSATILALERNHDHAQLISPCVSLQGRHWRQLQGARARCTPWPIFELDSAKDRSHEVLLMAVSRVSWRGNAARSAPLQTPYRLEMPQSKMQPKKAAARCSDVRVSALLLTSKAAAAASTSAAAAAVLAAAMSFTFLLHSTAYRSCGGGKQWRRRGEVRRLQLQVLQLEASKLLQCARQNAECGGASTSLQG